MRQIEYAETQNGWGGFRVATLYEQSGQDWDMKTGWEF